MHTYTHLHVNYIAILWHSCCYGWVRKKWRVTETLRVWRPREGEWAGQGKGLLFAEMQRGPISHLRSRPTGCNHPTRVAQLVSQRPEPLGTRKGLALHLGQGSDPYRFSVRPAFPQLHSWPCHPPRQSPALLTEVCPSIHFNHFHPQSRTCRMAFLIPRGEQCSI